MASFAPAAAIFMVMFAVDEFAGELESVAVTASEYVPGVVGVPLMLHPFRESPAGRLPPAMEQEYGAVPPDTSMVPVYAVPTVPAAGELMDSVAGMLLLRMLRVSGAEPLDPFLSVA